MKNNIYDKFINKILKFPLWIKQAIYLRLAKEMQENYCEKFLNSTNNASFVNFVPTVTFAGKAELTDKKCGFDSNLYNFLQFCLDDYSLIEISANTFLSLEEVSKIFEFCIEQGFVEPPKSNDICAMAGYISSKIRLGEYLLQVGLIQQDQLNLAIELCKAKNEQKFGEIIVKEKFVKPEDLKAILILKAESQKRFILDYNALPEANLECADINQKYQQEITLLKDENKRLKKKMEHLLELIKQNDSF